MVKMDSFEKRIEKACKDGDIPGAILVASSTDGKYRYEKAFGVRSLKDNSPLKTDTTMWLASCTKLMTVIAVLQCVEKGLFSLDEDVSRILPELKGRDILVGIDENKKPILVPSKGIITLRQMLTHQAGLSYDGFNPLLLQFQQLRRVRPGSGYSRSFVESYDYPNLFEPGESWEYSPGLDWAGEMVSRATKLSLDEYMQKHIWAPVGARSLTLLIKNSTCIKEKLAEMSQRDCGVTMFGTAEDPYAKLKWTAQRVWDQNAVACHGGASGHGNTVDYHKIMHSICADDGKLLKPETVSEMFKPQLTKQAKERLNDINSIPEMCGIFGGIEGVVDHALGGALNLEPRPGRSAGSISWGGYPNLMWMIDRAAGVSAIISTQIIPPGDLQVVNLFKAFTQALYKDLQVEPKENL